MALDQPLFTNQRYECRIGFSVCMRPTHCTEGLTLLFFAFVGFYMLTLKALARACVASVAPELAQACPCLDRLARAPLTSETTDEIPSVGHSAAVLATCALPPSAMSIGAELRCRGGHPPPLPPVWSAPPAASQTSAAAAWAASATVTLLGTGSAEPSRHRGSSGIYLESGRGHGVLLDAGEGIYNQMVRIRMRRANVYVLSIDSWGKDIESLNMISRTAACQVHLWGWREACLRVLRLRLVWISHKHADHCLGIQTLLGTSQRQTLWRVIGSPSCIPQHYLNIPRLLALYFRSKTCAVTLDRISLRWLLLDRTASDSGLTRRGKIGACHTFTLCIFADFCLQPPTWDKSRTHSSTV